jgi:hypothetical protein
MKQFTIRVPEETYEVLEKQGELMGLNPAVMARSWLVQRANVEMPMYKQHVMVEQRVQKDYEERLRAKLERKRK